ncbi:PAS domain-containing hybrid sensor histidine kinase/response regulator [Algoriphagus halophytocola]|uniref:histidine kinase n=1 Tax=Algoriphagus halophytocola TaxID=2991499 RepID=A0ABY6MIP9_9BACT|nr:PAS domain-containing hybrid sensor histidine kinase/response regulator [Algoriphagus sp. TR-M5]UZD23655.1 ATP-binding protein [Algoriphagus sp. TR-M5]
MRKKLTFKREFWLTVLLGGGLVVLVIALGVSFFRAITDTQIESRKEFLRRQTELAASGIELEIDRFEEESKYILDFLIDDGLDAEDYKAELTGLTRRLFNRYPGLIDTLYMNLADSAVYFTMTDRNDFIRQRLKQKIPSHVQQESLLKLSSQDNRFQLTFTLNLVRFTRDFVTHYYLNDGGLKLLSLDNSLQNLNQRARFDHLEFDEESHKAMVQDYSIGVIGIYEVDWKDNERSGEGILVQYPFDYGDLVEHASLLFMIESETITSGVYSTYFLLFIGLILLLTGTVVFFTISLQQNLESQRTLKKNSEEISELFDQQNLLLKELKGFIFFHNYKGEITRVSNEVEQVLGHSKKEFLDAFSGTVFNSDVSKVKDLVIEALGENKSFIDLEYEFRKPSGEVVQLRLFEKLIFDEEGRFNGGLGICTDVTTQYNSQQELIESGKRLQNLIENIPDILFIFDNSGTILDFYIKKQKFISSSPDLKGKSLFEILPEGDVTNVRIAFDKARETGQIQTVDLELEGEDGKQFFEVRYFPLDDQQMMSITKEITSQRIWEQGLVEAMNAADQASRAKSEFLANMSHEIRTPMNGLLGIIDLLEQTDLNEEQREYLEIIQNSGNSLLRIIKDILDYSKIEAGKIDINLMIFSPAEELDKQVDIFYGLAQRKDIKLITNHGPGTSDMMEADAGKINQVILNLVGNAVKFTPKGGEVKVSLELEQISKDLFYLNCEVKDSGIGIAKEDIPKLINPFYQVESSSSRSFQGTGLGLAIANKIVELMGGELTICSEPGLGSTFSFSVLTKRAEAGKMDIKESSLPARTNWNGMAEEYPIKLLLAEDNELNLQLMTLMLEQLGYEFEVAKNGLEVLELVKAKEYELVLMDVQMPVVNGLEATRRIRQLAEKGKVYVIGLSANVFDEDHKKAEDAGMDDYLNKPIRLAVLAEKLKEYALKVRQLKSN